MDFLGVALINLVLVMLFYKELQLSTFDPLLAGLFGFMPAPHPLRPHDHGVPHRGGFPSSGRRHPRYWTHDRTSGHRLFMDRLCESHAY